MLQKSKWCQAVKVMATRWFRFLIVVPAGCLLFTAAIVSSLGKDKVWLPEEMLSSSAIMAAKEVEVEEVTTDDLVYSLAEVAALPPTSPPSPSCAPPPLPSRPRCEGQPGLTGSTLSKPRKLVLLILFSFEADTLEVALREQHDMVDKIFLVEATTTHKAKPKPLMWERLKFTERFQFVNSTKVAHIVVDDRLRSRRAEDEQWFAERAQTDHGVNAVLTWAMEEEGNLGPEDLFISGDVDEILSRQALHQLKWCEVKQDVITGALWMPLGNLGRALRTDFPVHARPHTFSLPTIYKWKKVARRELNGRRLQEKFPCLSAKESCHENYVLGGTHMTNPALLISRILKELTATEDTFYGGYVNTDYLFSMTEDDADREQELLYRLNGRPCWAANTDPISEAVDVETTPPWWLQCNPQRFPYWFGKPDPRNKQLVEKLRKIKKSMRFSESSYYSHHYLREESEMKVLEEKLHKELFSRGDFITGGNVRDSNGKYLCGLSQIF